MNTLVISDTHFTKKFQQKRFEKLKTLIGKVDQVIINGDFWEGMSITFDEFMNSKWKKLFPILKSKNTIYVYGNHDDKRLSDNRVFEFCNQVTENYELETPKRNYFFTHGQNFLYPRKTDRDESVKKSCKPSTRFDIATANILQRTIFGLLGPNILPKSFNNIDQQTREKITSIDNLLVCGHSHTPQYKPEINFMDIGFFNYGWANYLLIDNQGEFEFKSERY